MRMFIGEGGILDRVIVRESSAAFQARAFE
jgi:hypothetical protein